MLTVILVHVLAEIIQNTISNQDTICCPSYNNIEKCTKQPLKCDTSLIGTLQVLPNARGNYCSEHLATYVYTYDYCHVLQVMRNSL